MRAAWVVLLVMCAQSDASVVAKGQTPPAWTERHLNLIPTSLEELAELRIKVGTTVALSNGDLNEAYMTKYPAAGNTYLQFHLDVATTSGPARLQAEEIRLEGTMTRSALLRPDGAKSKRMSDTSGTVAYTPLDWLLEDGLTEPQAGEMTVRDKAILQFTIEVPRAGLDDLALFIRSQRVGTVGEIREQLSRYRDIEPRAEGSKTAPDREAGSVSKD